MVNQDTSESSKSRDSMLGPDELDDTASVEDDEANGTDGIIVTSGKDEASQEKLPSIDEGEIKESPNSFTGTDFYIYSRFRNALNCMILNIFLVISVLDNQSSTQLN